MENEKKVRHLGSRWSQPRDAGDDNRILKALFRLGSQVGEGKLAAYCHFTDGKNDARFQAALKRLQEYNCLEFRSASHGEAVRVTLTSEGKIWGLELTCTEQVIPSGGSLDHVNLAKNREAEASK
jgi:hypothetical protein